MKKLEFKKKKPIINGWIHSPCTLSAEVLGNSNFTSITVDLQHGMLDFNHCRNILQILNTILKTLHDQHQHLFPSHTFFQY